MVFNFNTSMECILPPLYDLRLAVHIKSIVYWFIQRKWWQCPAGRICWSAGIYTTNQLFIGVFNVNDDDVLLVVFVDRRGHIHKNITLCHSNPEYAAQNVVTMWHKGNSGIKKRRTQGNGGLNVWHKDNSGIEKGGLKRNVGLKEKRRTLMFFLQSPVVNIYYVITTIDI